MVTINNNAHLYAQQGLIEAQNNFKGDWCLVWKSTDKVRKNTRLKIDLADAAIKNIFEYMDLYKDECK